MVEEPTCWKLVGGGGVGAVSIWSRAGKRAAAEDVELRKEAESTVMAALLRNGLDDAIATRFSARSSQVIFLGVSRLVLLWFELIVCVTGEMER